MLASAGIVPGIRNTVQVFAGAIILVLMAGCGTLYELEINAKNPDQSGLQGSYVLVPGSSVVSIGSPEFQKYSAQVERGLSGSELRRLPPARIADADMVIVVNYLVGEPEAIGYSTKVPMFQTRTVADSEEGTKEGGQSSGSRRGSNASRGVVDAPPAEDLVGTQSYTFVRTQYWREFSLQAITFELRGPDKSSVHKTGSLWTVSVNTAGSSGDLDEVVPVMVAAAQPYVGTHSEELIVEKINGTNRRIKTISEGM